MRHGYSLTGLIALLLLAGCAGEAPHEEATGDARPRRRFEFTYRVSIPAPASAERVELWVPLPMEDPGVQEVSELEIDAPSGYRVGSESLHGNRMIHCSVPASSGDLEVTWRALITRYEDAGQGRRPTGGVHLGATRLVPVDGEASELAVSLGATERALSVRERARRIYDDVLGGMEYDKSVPGYGRGDFQRAITVCKGNCTDFHARFIGVARAAQIPTRFTMGVPLKPQPEGSYDSYHCWAHFRDGERWIPVDISEADKVALTDPARALWFFGHLDADRIALSCGRDVVLEPAQRGEALNHFVFPYAEADGAKLALDRSMWEFTYRNR